MRYEIGGLLVCLGALLACGSNATYQRLTKDPKKGDLVSVECDRREDCYDAARKGCRGDFTIEDSGSKVHRDAAMLVRCAPK
jgi:hypothetical protein